VERGSPSLPSNPLTGLDMGKEVGAATPCSLTLQLSEVDVTEEEKKGFFKAIKQFIYGMAAHDSARFALKTRASMEHLFILVTMGDMLGVPLLPPYYSLRLLPYVVPQISTWKRRMLREKDLTDALA
jgi:hypothetical protein